MRLRIGAAALVAALACSGDTGVGSPGAGLELTVLTYECGSGCGVLTAPVDTVRQGDTAIVRLRIADTAGTNVVALLRASCAPSVTILGGSVLHSLPAAATCPDSAIAADIGAAPYLRDVVWVVDSSYAVGDYTLRGDIVINPPVTARQTVHVQ